MNRKLRIISVVLVMLWTLGMAAVASAEYVGIIPEEHNIALKIEQKQLKRNESTDGVEFGTYGTEYTGKRLLSGVYEEENLTNPSTSISVNGKSSRFWNNVKNSVDDIIVVENVSQLSEGENRENDKKEKTAYVRTVFAFPVFSDGETHLHLNFHKTGHVDADALEDKIITEINGQRYWLYAYNYEGKLAPGETTEPSLLEYVFDKDVTTELFDEFGDNYQVLITSQAVQVTGFSTLADAFGKTFYNVTAQNHPWKDVISDVELTSVQ